MSTYVAATYIIGYLTPLVACAYFITYDFVKKPAIANGIAKWFFLGACGLQLFGTICDWTLR